MLIANATSQGLFGYSLEQLQGQSIEILVPERFRVRHGAHLAAFLRDPTAREMGARVVDLFARRADGTEFPAGIRLSPIRDGDKTFVAMAIRDMTERRAINDALVAAREAADRANMAKTRFLATASHDLRQPLQAIRLLNASLLNMTAATATSDVHDLLKRQESAIDSASSMLNSLLDITRLEAGAVEPHLSSISLASIFDDLQREFDSAAGAKGLRLEFAQTSRVLTTDRILCSQLLQNILGNAIKYTDRGFVKISEEMETERLVLCVEDSGRGIPNEKLGRIFDDYYQVDPPGTPRSGVGLGLAIVREVSRLLGYSVAVTSELGRGTQVRVRIPKAKLDTPASHTPDPAPAPAAKSSPATRCRVILLEDNDSVRASTELFLTLEGYETHGASSIADAEGLLANLQPGDLLISDYHLNGPLTGYDVLNQVRTQHRRDVPAVLLSGDLQSMMRVVKTSIPACRFLSKPVDTNALLAAIAELSGN
jgi:PAS domain S-box-containing protein